jgi:hypothetical protein
MSDEQAGPEIKIHEKAFPEGHNFPEDILREWVAIPEDEPVLIGPLSRRALDHLLFSISDISSSIASLRAALIAYTGNDLATADKLLINSMNHLVDGETRNRLLFGAIMRSVIEVRKNAGK